jgi:hypothetical protein
MHPFSAFSQNPICILLSQMSILLDFFFMKSRLCYSQGRLKTFDLGSQCLPTFLGVTWFGLQRLGSLLQGLHALLSGLHECVSAPV